MKYCNQCGNQLVDAAVVCPKCGCMSGPKPVPNARSQEKTQEKNVNSGMVNIIKALLIVGTVSLAITMYFIPLAWCIPMILYYNKKVGSGQPIGLGFAICTMLFVCMPAGILMLCDQDNLY